MNHNHPPQLTFQDNGIDFEKILTPIIRKRGNELTLKIHPANPAMGKPTYRSVSSGAGVVCKNTWRMVTSRPVDVNLDTNPEALLLIDPCKLDLYLKYLSVQIVGSNRRPQHRNLDVTAIHKIYKKGKMPYRYHRRYSFNTLLFSSRRTARARNSIQPNQIDPWA